MTEFQSHCRSSQIWVVTGQSFSHFCLKQTSSHYLTCDIVLKQLFLKKSLSSPREIEHKIRGPGGKPWVGGWDGNCYYWEILLELTRRLCWLVIATLVVYILKNLWFKCTPRNNFTSPKMAVYFFLYVALATHLAIGVLLRFQCHRKPHVNMLLW